MLRLIFSSLLVVSLTGCGLLSPRPESADEIIEKASQQKIFYAPYDSVWRAAHSALSYTIANENQDYGVIETDFIKSVDGWMRPDRTRPEYKSARYKLLLTFARGATPGRESTRVTIEKKIEIFRDFVSEKTLIPSDGLEEQSIFYRIEREILIQQALKRAASAVQ